MAKSNKEKQKDYYDRMSKNGWKKIWVPAELIKSIKELILKWEDR